MYHKITIEIETVKNKIAMAKDTCWKNSWSIKL